MFNQEIPLKEWREFCESFSREHHGWLVSVGLVNTQQLEHEETIPKDQLQILADNYPLQEVMEAQKDDDVEFMVTVGKGTNESSYLIKDVVRLYAQKENGGHKGLRIDSRNATTTLVQFRAAAEPQALDGLAESEL